ncbi:MAG: hypothetical protein M3N57_09895 [Actinomycetota bacterium]|nr:hypothetical protein [Actinomycetota bacterium]
MSASVVIGFVLTGVAMLAFLGWTYRQVRRVDHVIRDVDGRRSRTG